jgi:hypothetical protein
LKKFFFKNFFFFFSKKKKKKVDGEAFIFGYNDYGLGLGEGIKEAKKPTKINFLDSNNNNKKNKVDFIVCGYDHCFAIMMKNKTNEKQKIFGFGSNKLQKNSSK